MTMILSVVSRKGGTGKTTTAVNLAAYLSDNFRVLLIDIDSQCGATYESGIYNTDTPGINDLLTGKKSVEEVLHKTTYKYDMIISTPMLSFTEMSMNRYNTNYLKKLISPIEDRYDIIIIDTPPTESPLTAFSIVASTHIIITAQTDRRSLDSLALTVDEVYILKENVNPNLKIIGILPTMHYSKAIVSRVMLEKMQEKYKELVLPFIVKYSAVYKEASLASIPLRYYLNKSALEDEPYNKLATYIGDICRNSTN